MKREYNITAQNIPTSSLYTDIKIMKINPG